MTEGDRPVERSDDAPGEGERPILDLTADMLADAADDSRVEFERGMSYAAPATLLIVALCTAIFCWQVASGGLESGEALVASGALVTDRLVRGEAWRLVTSLFLHGSPDHLVGNMVALFVLGIACEHAFGAPVTLGIYAAAGIVGGLASAAVVPLPTVGASGAIFGLMGSVVAMLARRQRHLHVRDGRIGFVIGAWATWQLALGFLSPMVANMAHLGGLLTGAILGWLVEPRLLVVRRAVQPRTSERTSSET